MRGHEVAYGRGGLLGYRHFAQVEPGSGSVAVHVHQMQAVPAGVDRQHCHDVHLQPVKASMPAPVR